MVVKVVGTVAEALLLELSVVVVARVKFVNDFMKVLVVLVVTVLVVLAVDKDDKDNDDLFDFVTLLAVVACIWLTVLLN